MPSTDRKLELKAKTSVAQTGSQPFVYAKGLMNLKIPEDIEFTENKFSYLIYLQLISLYTNRVGFDFTYPVGF
jgi:hypothetical protein